MHTLLEAVEKIPEDVRRGTAECDNPKTGTHAFASSDVSSDSSVPSRANAG